LRYYEEQGLLRPSRRPSGYREFSAADVQTVHRIRTMLAAGLGTATIAEILPCMTNRADRLGQVCPELAAGLSLERDRISNAIAELVTARHMLDAIIEAPAALLR
jgi:DNA-binding transcriptional MerR regulator